MQFFCFRQFRTVFQLLTSGSESIRLQALKLFGFFLQRSTLKYEQMLCSFRSDSHRFSLDGRLMPCNPITSSHCWPITFYSTPMGSAWLLTIFSSKYEDEWSEGEGVLNFVSLDSRGKSEWTTRGKTKYRDFCRVEDRKSRFVDSRGFQSIH